MRRVRAKLERDMGLDPTAEMTAELRSEIAAEIGAPLRDVELMEARLAGPDFSLNAKQTTDDGAREWMETLECDAERTDEAVARDSDRSRARRWIAEAMSALSDREKMIIVARKVTDEPETLESLGGKLGLSKERVRQLEVQALGKMRRALEDKLGAGAAAELTLAV